MNEPFFSIIIPTRDRPETIVHSINTVLNQSFKDFEIILSDNSTNNITSEVIKNIEDTRIHYFKTGGNLSMTENWEYSLSQAKGKYILYIGDDDGLLSQALEKCHHALIDNKTEVLFFDWVGYVWPDQYNDTITPNKINFHFINDSEKPFNYQVNFNDIIAARQYYYAMPTIYTSFVSKIFIKEIISKNGKFFNSICPDIYSGMVLCSKAKTIFKLNSYLGIRGTSKFSNGATHSNTTDKNKHIKADFITLNNNSKIVWNKNIPFISNNYAYVLEAYIQYREEFKIPLSRLESFLIFIRLIRRVFFDLSIDSQRIKQDFETIQKTIQSTKLLNIITRTILIQYISFLLNSNKKINSDRLKQQEIDSISKNKFGLVNNNQIIINGANFNINNVLDLQTFIEKLLNQGYK